MKTRDIISVIILIILVGGAFYISKNPIEEEQIVGGDKDEQGCLIAAGYSWCEAKQECLRPWEEGCADYISDLFVSIEDETKIDFSDSEEIELNWQVEDEEAVKTLTLSALMISADEVKKEDFEKIRPFMQKEGFEDDKYNGMGSFFGEHNAYRKDNFNLVCTTSGIFSDFDPDDKKYEPETTDRDVKITCALLDKSLVPKISDEKRIREALAQKHNKKVSQTEISVEQKTENHAKGGVVFQPGGSENSGMFLAAKVNDLWQIVFDGNGTPTCLELEDYNFPEDMIEGACY